jgi:hypothetical protein
MPLQNHVVVLCVAFVAAARFPGGQLLVSQNVNLR